MCHQEINQTTCRFILKDSKCQRVLIRFNYKQLFQSVNWSCWAYFVASCNAFSIAWNTRTVCSLGHGSGCQVKALRNVSSDRSFYILSTCKFLTCIDSEHARRPCMLHSYYLRMLQRMDTTMSCHEWLIKRKLSLIFLHQRDLQYYVSLIHSNNSWISYNIFWSPAAVVLRFLDIFIGFTFI